MKNLKADGLLEKTGRKIIRGLEEAGGTICLLARGICQAKSFIRSRSKITEQMRSCGVGSLLVVGLVSMFYGMIASLESGLELSRFHLEDMLGALVAVSMCRELAPVATAIIVAGRVGAKMSAELGTMKVSEEVDALETMSINPVRFLVMPRLFAITMTLPILFVFSVFIGTLGGAIIANNIVNVPYPLFFQKGVEFLEHRDILQGLVKSIVFALTIGAISCFQGLNASGGAEGVGKATTRAVVFSFLFILVFDYFLTRMFY